MKLSLRNELARAMANHHYERTDDGRVLFPHQGLFVGGAFRHTVNGADARLTPNGFVNESLDDVLSVYFKGSSQRTGFYIAPFANEVDPDPATLKASNFTSVMGEFTDYSQAQRPQWTPGDVADQQVDNAASMAAFTLTEDGSIIWGWAMLTAAAKQATTGILVCCAKDDEARSGLRSGDKLNSEYQVVASDA